MTSDFNAKYWNWSINNSRTAEGVRLDSLISLYVYLSVFSSNVGKYGPEKNPYLDTFCAVTIVKYGIKTALRLI